MQSKSIEKLREHYKHSPKDQKGASFINGYETINGNYLCSDCAWALMRRGVWGSSDEINKTYYAEDKAQWTCTCEICGKAFEKTDA